ncbi:MAG: AAA family ATPase [Candidatus Omnitrophica bacterium]|nr:AAA family ATPase [Candidatus Omnitrophota bacterium]
MYFKRLELIGFKSFMNKTVLDFEPGITAIVGPNGCGKSNIFDAIRWVLGEQSAKSLRGSNMEDVIFNGTDSQQPLGMAEVSLTFDNKERVFPVDHDEVLITRRIFRSGESEYLLNKAQCRLKDIQDLLLGTGIGAESYSIIAQGKVDLILSARPEERREVFDEASGITKYKAQKKEALRRLEETEQNLLRINDIIGEVKRSIGYLERQANKARRYQQVFGQLRAKEVLLAFIQKKRLVAQKEKIILELENLRFNKERLQQTIQQEEDAIAQRKEQIKQLEINIDALNKQLIEEDNDLRQSQQHISFNQERIRELENTKAYLSAQVQESSARLVQEEATLIEFRERLDQVKTALIEKTEKLKTKQQELDNLIFEIRQATETISKAKQQIIDLAAQEATVKNELLELSSKNNILLARQKRLEIEKTKIAEERLQIEKNLAQANQEITQLEILLQDLDAQIIALTTQQNNKQIILTEIAQKIEELERQRLSLESQKEFLEKLKHQYEDIHESLNALIILDRLPQDKINGLVVKINSEEINQIVHQEAIGYQVKGEAKPIDLDAHVVSQRLQKVYVELEQRHKEKDFLKQAIKELQEVIEIIKQKRQEQDLMVANKRTIAQTIIEQFEKVKKEEELLAWELEDVHKEIKDFTDRIKLVQRRLEEIQQENKFLEQEINRRQEIIGINTQKRENTLVEIAQIKTELENYRMRLQNEEANVRMAEDAVSITKANITNLENKSRETEYRQQGLLRQITELEENIKRIEIQITQKNQQLKENQEKYSLLSASIQDIVNSIEHRRRQVEEMNDRIYQLQMKEKDIDYQYQTMRDRLYNCYKLNLDELNYSLVLQEQRNGFVQDESNKNLFKITSSYESNKDTQQLDKHINNNLYTLSNEILLIELIMPKPKYLALPFLSNELNIETIDENNLLCEISALKEKVASYGNVNLIAIEEYDELKKRYDFLNQQQQDLIKAKDSLQEAIRKMNSTSRKMFLETFERVRQEFRNYFKLLFGGGDAQIYLIDENQPLDSGIEIICRPPGKKLQNVMLLSGGEKSLAAIALIFAIFKVKPAPFCVLDEIDAALDEANVDRFGRLLQEFVKTSQFIVITHNKRTIANADVMYGITMQESGVSKIVSVKFSDSKKQKEEKLPQPVAA